MSRFICGLMIVAGLICGLATGPRLLAQEQSKPEPVPAAPVSAEPDAPKQPAAPSGEPKTKAADAGHADEKAGHDHKHTDEGGHTHADPKSATHADPKHGDEGGHAHAEHDPLDKTHANATKGLSQAEEMRFDLAIATFIVFVLLSIILAKFAWGPISDGLDKREAGIAAMIDQARLAQSQAEAQLRSYETKLAAAAEEARTIVSQARHDAEVARDRIQAEAKDLAAKERQRAVDDITAAKNAALQQIAERSVNTAISLASSIVRREVRPEDHDTLVTEALGQFSKLN